MTAPLRPARLLLLPAVLALLLPALAPAQKEDVQDKRKAILEGTHVFRRLIFDLHLQPLKDFDDEMIRTEPEKCILVVLGDLNQLHQLPEGLGTFLRGGGAILAASDRPVRNRQVADQLLEIAGVSINGETLLAPEGSCYKNLPYCPWVQPVKDAEPSLFRGADKVATNVPSMLVPRRRSVARPLARLPAGCRLETKQGKPLEGQPLFAVGGEFGQGRVLVLADHSVFINEMMMPTDNNNVEFAYNCIDWLRGNDRGENQRDHVLFVEDGRIQEKFAIPLQNAAIPPEKALELLFAKRNEFLVEVERGTARLEETGFFDNKVSDLLVGTGLPPNRLWTWVAVLGTAVLLIYGLIRLGIRHRFRHDTSVPLLVGAVGKNLPTAPLVEQRTEALLQRNNLWEPAAMMVRRWFARLGIEPDKTEPIFQARGGWWQRRRLLKRVQRLWRLGLGLQPQRIAAPQMWRLQRELEELRAGWQSGAWGVAPAPATDGSRRST